MSQIDTAPDGNGANDVLHVTARSRWRTMARLAVAMTFHDRLRFVGTIAGVFFAVVLADQQAGTFLGLIEKNTMFVEHAGADVWLVPPYTLQLQPGKPLPLDAVAKARATEGVAWAEPLIYGIAVLALPRGGSEQVTLVGTRAPRFAGGPWNIVTGSREVLLEPDTMVFEDSQREKYGNLDLGGIRELNGVAVRAGGFTWGLLPFGPAYAFADEPLARRVLGTNAHETSFVLIGVEPGADPAEVARRVGAQLPELQAVTTQAFRRTVLSYVLTRTAIGVTFGTSTLFGLVIGFVTVSLAMFASVVDNVRQFGTLKALGATTTDLARLLFVQSVIYAALGSLCGLATVVTLANLTRSPNLAVSLPPVMIGATVVVITLLCIAASGLSLLRLRKVEPGLVFR